MMMNNTKRIIVFPSNGTILSGHFGRATHFVAYHVENGKIVNREIHDAPEHEQGTFPNFIVYLGATDVIAGGMGPSAINYLNEAGVNVYLGAKEIDVSSLIEDFLNGTLKLSENLCNHGEEDHDHHHHH